MERCYKISPKDTFRSAKGIFSHAERRLFMTPKDTFRKPLLNHLIIN